MSKDERINLTPAQRVDLRDSQASRQRDLRHADLQSKQNALQQLQKQHSHQQTRSRQQRRGQVQYQLKQVIGKGSYGIVYKALNKKTNQIVAIKEVNYENDDELTDIMSEIDLLKNLNHINIVKYHGFIQKSHNLYIILEYCSHGSLKNLISRGNGLSESKAKAFVRQTLHGLHYLHEQGVIHRDIKAANLLLDSNNVVKLADFGVSTQVNTIMMAMTLAGSLNWMAPEIISNRGATTLSDIWSLGATVLELLTGNPPFHNLVDLNIYYAIENDSFIPPNFLSSLAQDFLLSCFQKNMYKRPTASQLLKHKWLNDNHELNKLEQYQEINNDYKWDQDFKELNIVDNQDKVTGDDTILPTKVDPFSEVFFSEPINQAQLTILFNDLGPQALATKAIKIAEAKSKHEEVLMLIFQYDLDFNDSKVKEYFIKLGGLPSILDNIPILERFFIKDHYKALIQTGILSHQSLGRLHDSLKFELIFKYLEISNSIQFWCSWCSKNVQVSDLLRRNNLPNKFVQSIILKLSLYDDNSIWFHQQLVNNLLKTKYLTEDIDQPSLSVIFKALSSILIKSHKNSLISPIISSSVSSLSSLSIPSPTHSPSTSPHQTINHTSAARALSSNIGPNVLASSLHLPTQFFPWLMSFLDNPVFYNMKNLHVWKYYITVIYHSTHLNKVLIKDLMAHERFIRLVLSFASHPRESSDYYQNKECLVAVVHQSLSIMIELSNELQAFDHVYLEIALKLMDFDEACITGGLEVLFNCLQLGLHDETNNYTQNTKNSSITFQELGKWELTLHYYQLVDPFYLIKDDNVEFGNFITRFMKICSLNALGFISFKLILHPNFVERCMVFFKLYRNSLVIQIDLLKLIKLIFLRSFEYFMKMIKDNNEILSSIKLQLKNMVDFLSENWSRHESGQVGHDSILIHQLCNDISSLASSNASSLSSASVSTRFLDEDGFVIPK